MDEKQKKLIIGSVAGVILLVAIVLIARALLGSDPAADPDVQAALEHEARLKAAAEAEGIATQPPPVEPPAPDAPPPTRGPQAVPGGS